MEVAFLRCKLVLTTLPVLPTKLRNLSPGFTYMMDGDENNVVVDSITYPIEQDEMHFKTEFPSEDPNHHHENPENEQSEQTFRPQQTYIFVCEICNDTFTQQLKFFEHLKAHYGGVGNQQENLVEIQNEHVQTEFEVVAEQDGDSMPLTATLSYNMDTSSSSSTIATTTSTATVTKDIHMSLKKPEVQSIITTTMDETVVHNTTSSSSIITKVSLNCPKCKRNFRKEKTYQTHVENCRKQITITSSLEGEQLMYETETAKIKPKGRGRGKGNKQQQIILEQIVEESPPVDDDVQAGLVHSIPSDSLGHDEEDGIFEESFLVEADVIEEENEDDDDDDVVEGDEDGLFTDDGLSCVYCDEPFPTKARLNTHLKTYHSEELPLNDSISTKTSPSKKPNKRVTGQNKKPDVLKCTQCQRIFNHRNSLVYHMRSHTGERPHQCELCGKSFFATSALKVHMRLHSGEKPYKCESCGRFFRQWGDLKYHMISIHSDIRQYQCEFCGKDFARKYSLIVHRRIHTGERNYKCEFCGKCFRAASYLQNHRRIHTGEKPHSCNICGKPFRVRSDMKRHMASHSREHNHNSSNVSVVNTTSTSQTVQNVVTVSSINNSNQQIITIGPQITQQLAQAVRNGTATIVSSSPTTSSVVIPTTTSVSPDGNSNLQQQTQPQQITINENEVVITGDISEGGTPINITLTPQEGLTANSLGNGVAIQEGGSGTLYVWPVFMN